MKSIKISFSDNHNEVRKSRKDRKCEKCLQPIMRGEHYVHSVLFPMPWDEMGFRTINWCFHCIPNQLWAAIWAKMLVGENKIEHSQREHDINVYNYGACDDDAHDPNNW
jgi:hypothetical protein